jgi:predicted pyridoxine 5'-phosphate oxidase superfamily flavin-nucleotide-binding protein
MRPPPKAKQRALLMRIQNPFHQGELEAQNLAGETAIAQRNSAVISDSIIGGALPFLKQQRMVVLGTEAEDGSLWASPVFGVPGFVSPESDQILRFHGEHIRSSQADMVWRNLSEGARAGMLAIELSTRRRLRVNGKLRDVDSTGFALAVEEAFPNCPKYIQRRALHWSEEASRNEANEVLEGSAPSSEAVDIIDRADTLFIVSAHAGRGLDVSHRGGNPGFLQRQGASSFRVPDYSGNGMFNTFGNLLADPHAGVTVMDFANGQILQMTGEAAIEWNQPDPQGVTGGTGRFWTFLINRWRIFHLPATARWEFLDASPFLPSRSRSSEL